MKKIGDNDVVLFDNASQLLEYINLSGDDYIAPLEYENFPRIQSAHWSFHCSFNNGHHFEIKQTALTRLISWAEYKNNNQETQCQK